MKFKFGKKEVNLGKRPGFREYKQKQQQKQMENLRKYTTADGKKIMSKSERDEVDRLEAEKQKKELEEYKSRLEAEIIKVNTEIEGLEKGDTKQAA